MIRRRLAVALFGAGLVLSGVVPAPIAAADPPRRPQLPDAARSLKLEDPISASDGVRPVTLAASLRGATGVRQVVIRLKEQPAAALKGAANQKAQAGKVRAQQTAFIGRAHKATASFNVLGRTRVALNAVIAQVDAKALAKLSRDPAVESIRPVVDYQLDLDETVPYIGGTAVHQAGATGAGVLVGVLDSGVDYTHAALGGPGTVLAYKNAYGTKLKDTKNEKTNDAY